MRVVVFGAGAVGGHLAARLAAHGSAAGIEVAAIARGAQLEAMNQRGITLWIGEERTAAPIHATDRPETLGRQDVVLVTLKSSVLTADVGVADASLAARRATQPIGTPDEIIEKIRTLQHALSLEMVVIHFFYGGMPRAKAEKSLRLFAEKVLPAVQAMPTPINQASLGQPES